MRKKKSFPKVVGLTLVLIGATSLLVATIYASSVPALIGLGLVFWGIILTYIQPDLYIKKTVLDSISTTLLVNLDETLMKFEYEGKAIYLPPKYLNDPESIKVYVPKQKTGILPPPDSTQKLETQPLDGSTQGLLVIPPGTGLARLLETTLGTSFIRTDLKTLEQRLPKALVEDLEIMTDCEIQSSSTQQAHEGSQIDQNTILVKFTTNAYKETCKRATQLPMIFSNIGCPLSSALAIAFAQATGKPITIKKQKTSENGETNETEYAISEEKTT